MKKCPCCKVLNTMKEAVKHPSISSLQAARVAFRPFSNLGVEENQIAIILDIAECPIHSLPGEWTKFLSEFDHIRDEAARRLKCQQ